MKTLTSWIKLASVLAIAATPRSAARQRELGLTHLNEIEKGTGTAMKRLASNSRIKLATIIAVAAPVAALLGNNWH